jgi:ankyrin repeat protein
MRQLLITIAAVVLVGCGESQQSAPQTKPVEPVAEVPAQPSSPPPEAKPVTQAAEQELPTAKAPDISIHEAAEDGNIEAIKQHIAAGTDVNARDEWGETPLDFVDGLPTRKKIYVLLRENEAKSSDELEIELKDLAEMKVLKKRLAAGMDVNKKNGVGYTSLHVAAQNGYLKSVELLIAEGADVNAKNGPWGETPLHRVAGYIGAMTFKQKAIIELLIAEGADINAPRGDAAYGDTPLDRVFNCEEAKSLFRKLGGKTAEELKAEGK